MTLPAKAMLCFVSIASIASIASNKYELLLMINIMLTVLVTYMDMAPMILICTPILLPVVLIVTYVPGLSLWLLHRYAR